jgi:hypothetical protein
MRMIVPLMAVAALSLGGCVTGGKMTPEQIGALAKGFHDAGCGGRFDLDTGAATGQLGGAVHVQLGLHGECPVGNAPGVVVPGAVIGGDAAVKPGP